MSNPLAMQSNMRCEGLCPDVVDYDQKHVCQMKWIMTRLSELDTSLIWEGGPSETFADRRWLL
jgi:hypothetical protein